MKRPSVLLLALMLGVTSLSLSACFPPPGGHGGPGGFGGYGGGPGGGMGGGGGAGGPGGGGGHM